MLRSRCEGVAEHFRNMYRVAIVNQRNTETAMAPLPTMSLRAPTDHHRIIRDVAIRMRTDPTFLSALEVMLAEQRQHDALRRDTGDDVLQSALRRIAELEEAASLSAETAAIDALSHHNAMRDVLQRIAELETAMRVLRRNAAPTTPKPTIHDERQLDIEDITGHPAAVLARNAPEAKAERKAWGAEIKALPGAQGKTLKTLAEHVAMETGLATSTVLNAIGGSIAISADSRAKIRAAVEAMGTE